MVMNDKTLTKRCGPPFFYGKFMLPFHGVSVSEENVLTRNVHTGVNVRRLFWNVGSDDEHVGIISI